MRELALFAGAGGGILGGKLLGWTTVCAVELDPYCRSVLLARQRDGQLSHFPIWDDIKTFEGKPWAGSVDIVSGGFPCQAHSTAPRGRNTAEDLWPEMRRVIEEVQPRFVFSENVQRQPIKDAADDLVSLGYSRVRVARVGAASMGAPHDRPRWWLFADTNRKGERLRPFHGEVARVSSIARELWPEPGSSVLGVDDGVASRMVRLKAIGNGQVPCVAQLAWRLLGGG